MTGAFLPGMERFDAATTGLMTRFNSPGVQLDPAQRPALALGSKDAVVANTFVAQSYTAQVTGAGGTVGKAIVAG